MSIFLTQVSQSVQNELEARSRSLKTNGSWATRRTPWIRARAYAAEKAGDTNIPLSDKLAQENILFSQNKTSFVASYNASDSYKYRPIPVITSLDVTYKGVYGSSRRAVLAFKVWTLDQLDTYQKLYMVPGRTVLVEWGWSIDTDANSINYRNPDPQTDFKNNKLLIEHRNKYPNYDGFQGRVVNFSFTLDKDLSYNCTLELISTGDFIFNSNINEASLVKKTKDGISTNIRGLLVELYLKAKKEVQISDRTKFTTPINRKLLASEDQGNNNKSINSELRNFDTNAVMHTNIFRVQGTQDFRLTDADGKEIRLGQENNTVGPKAIPILPTWALKKSDDDRSEVYINFEGLLDIINQSFAKYDSSNNSPSKFKIFEPILISRHPILASTDTFICMFFEQLTFLSDNLSAQYTFSEYSCPIANSNPFTTAINYLWVDVLYLLNKIDNSQSVQDFITSVLKDISDCLGNICNLVYVVDENDPTTLKIVDSNVTNNISKSEIYQFKVNSLLLKEVAVATKMSDSLKSMVLYSNTSEKINTGGDATYLGYQRIAQNMVDTANPLYSYKDASNILVSKYKIMTAKTEEERNVAVNEFIQNNIVNNNDSVEKLSNLDLLVFAYRNLMKLRTEDTVNYANSSLKTYLQEGSDPDLQGYERFSSKNTSKNIRPDVDKILFPLELTLTIDGIGGFQFGNAISFDYLPKQYSDQLIFQIKQLNHKITMDTWDLSIETICRIPPANAK